MGTMLALSFYGYMRIIAYCMLIFTVRCMLPLFDIEKRKHIMGRTQWSLLTLI